MEVNKKYIIFGNFLLSDEKDESHPKDVTSADVLNFQRITGISLLDEADRVSEPQRGA